MKGQSHVHGECSSSSTNAILERLREKLACFLKTRRLQIFGTGIAFVLEVYVDDRMIDEMSSDIGVVLDDLDVVLLELIARSDSREFE